MQDQGILNVSYWIELYCLVKTKMKNLLSYSWQIEVRDRTEPRYGIQQFHWGQEWHWESSLTLSHMTHPNSLLWSDNQDHTLSLRTVRCTGFCKNKKKCTAIFWKRKYTWLYSAFNRALTFWNLYYGKNMSCHV